MRLEKAFGQARKAAQQTMEQWIGHVMAPATQLNSVGVDTYDNRIAHRILNRLGKEYRELKYSLRARTGVLTVDIVSQHLLAVENDYLEDVVVLPPLQNVQQQVLAPGAGTINTASYQVAPRQSGIGSMHGPSATAMLNTTLQFLQHQYSNSLPAHVQCIPTGHCGTVNVLTLPESHISSLLRPNTSYNWRFEPYNRRPNMDMGVACPVCGNFGHTKENCWQKYPHLKPRWMVDNEQWRRQRTTASRTQQQQTTQPMT